VAGHDLIDLESINMRLESDGDAWQPTPHGLTLARVLHEQPELVRDASVLELGAGLAVHTVLIERAGAKSVTATEITQEFLDATRKNMELNGCGSRTEYVVADWLDLSGCFDVIVANPPFAQSGKQNRRYFMDDLILNGFKRLNPGGRLVFIQSSMADLARTKRTLDYNGYDMRVLYESRGPFRDYYYEDPTFMAEIQQVEGAFEMVDGKEWETLTAIEATLRPYTPPATAHAVVD